MRLWTVQPEAVYNLIMTEGVYRCDPALSEHITECNFGKAYDWIADQMKKRIGSSPEGVKYPVWAWHTMDYKHKRPDMRGAEFRYIERPFVLMEIDIPDEDVLLSDEISWHIVLGDGYYPEVNSSEEFDLEYSWFQEQSLDDQNRMKLKSWERIFDIQYHNEYEWRDQYIQATFWELKKNNVVKVWHYT